ncbi:MAG TPA: hypothetical protein PK727_03020 [Bacteroidales bacterium]|nr:hypothetical protein [Bacteroidales bacterium]HNY52547.1 hypothetical protein [Bacteroidales bacterium]HOG56279.1 hypothetical protein [Bacteroidales bacterium]HPX43311.1 hypothetical protein [Bacteroidales bacterium]
MDSHSSRLFKLVDIIVIWQYRSYWNHPLSLVGFITIIDTWPYWGYWKIRKMYWVITDTRGVTIQ